MLDRQAASEALQLLATLIGEIMEDEVETALHAPMGDPFGSYPARLSQAGRDIATLASALAVVARRAGEGPPPG